MLDYWDRSDEHDFGVDFLTFPSDDLSSPSTNAPAPPGRSPRRSGSTDTIRPPRKHSSPPPPTPLQSHIELPFESSSYIRRPGIFSPGIHPRSPGSKPRKLQRERTYLPPPDPQIMHFLLSKRIHDDLPEFNTCFDYKTILLSSLKTHPVFCTIKHQLGHAAAAMANEDQKTGHYHRNGTPLLPRHVMSLPQRHPDVIGDTRESYVALLELIALHSTHDGLIIISVDRLCKSQKTMYQQVADELERDMRAEYNRIRGDAGPRRCM